jgi:two-component system NarL family sensor kinase
MVSRDAAAGRGHHGLVLSPAVPAPVAARGQGRVLVVAGVVVLAVLVLGAAVGRWANRDVAGTEFVTRFWTLPLVGGTAYGAAGAVLARLRPRLPLGWLLMGVGLTMALVAASTEYAIAVVDRHPGWPGAGPALWLAAWLWAPAYLVVALVLPLVLPEGHLPGPRHRPLLALAVAGVVVSGLQFLVMPYDAQVPPLTLGDLQNPTATSWWDAGWLRALSLVGLVTLVCGVVTVVQRWRRSTGAERAELSTTALGLLATMVVGAAAFLVPVSWLPAVLAVAAVPLPVSCVVAVLRTGLGDVDVVLSRALAYSLLSGLAAGGYVVLVSLLGGVLGTGTGLPVLVTALVAVAVAPAHRRVQRLVNRVVHGDARDPFAALAVLGEQLESAREPQAVADRLLPELVRSLTSALRREAALLLRDGSAFGARPTGPVERAPLTYAGERLGELVVDTATRPLSRGEHHLLDELARQSAVAAHGVLLGRDLARSREEIVSAREEERRRLRHDLHDGVGPALAAAALQVETARDVVGADPERAVELLDVVASRLGLAVDDVRRVVGGLRPAGLDDLGLPAALDELAHRFDTPGRTVTARTGDLPERSAAVDAAAYLVAAEAVTNAVRHGDATTVTVDLAVDDGALVLRVDDDGRGLPDPAPAGTGLSSMRARVEQVGGSFAVGPRQPSGTRVVARMPTATGGPGEPR